jgi:hypothetical protein
VSYSPKRKRAYVRLFDHDEALARLNNGESGRALAAKYGVSLNAVYRLRDKEADLERQRRWRAGTCEMCGGSAMRVVAGKREHNPDGRCLCIKCRGLVRRRRPSAANGYLVFECGSCHERKPLSDFPRRVRTRVLSELPLLTSTCRACETRKRQDYRERHKVPCEFCGKPCLPPNEKGQAGSAMAQCAPCFHERRRNGEDLSAAESAESS